MDERPADSEVYEDARDEQTAEEQSNDEFEEVESEMRLNEQSNDASIGGEKAGSSNEPDHAESEPDEAGDRQAKSQADEQREEERRAETRPDESPESDEQFTEEELNEKLARSTELKDVGNVHFKNQEYDKSLELYSKALVGCPNRFSDQKAIILNNRAVCRWKLLEASSDQLNFSDEKIKAEFDGIVADLSRAIELNPNYFKPYLKRAEFNHRFGGDKLDSSLEDYKKVLEMLPVENGKLRNEIKYEIAKLQKEIEERNEKLKQEMFAQLKNLGNLCLRPFGLSTDNFKLQQNENGGYSVNFQQ